MISLRWLSARGACSSCAVQPRRTRACSRAIAGFAFVAIAGGTLVPPPACAGATPTGAVNAPFSRPAPPGTGCPVAEPVRTRGPCRRRRTAGEPDRRPHRGAVRRPGTHFVIAGLRAASTVRTACLHQVHPLGDTWQVAALGPRSRGRGCTCSGARVAHRLRSAGSTQPRAGSLCTDSEMRGVHFVHPSRIRAAGTPAASARCRCTAGHRHRATSSIEAEAARSRSRASLRCARQLCLRPAAARGPVAYGKRAAAATPRAGVSVG